MVWERDYTDIDMYVWNIYNFMLTQSFKPNLGTRICSIFPFSIFVVDFSAEQVRAYLIKTS